MAIRNIVTIGDPVLREKSREVTLFDSKLGTLIDDMIETMFDAAGVGLAAPQVGILRRVCVISTDGDKVYELVNPRIIKSSGEQTGPEGCLSIPGRQGIVTRPKKLTVEAFDRFGKKVKYNVEGFTAVAFCHEMDHLDGVLYIDKTEKEDK
ncbi:MAG: peptide deformylase [Christensenellales bacterium]